jgi:hypothetical protein
MLWALYGRFAIELVCFQKELALFGSVSAKIRVVSGVKNHSDRAFLAGIRIFRPSVPDPDFGQEHLRLEIPLFLHFGLPPTDHSDTFLPGFSGFRYGRTRP